MLRNRISKIKIYIFKIQIINSGPHVKKKPLSQYTDTSTYPRIQYVMRVKNGALHQRASSDSALYPTVPSKKERCSKTVTSCRQCKGGTSRLVLSSTLERERYVGDSEEKEGKQDILYSWTRAREIHCDEFTKRGAISMASFSLKQLSIGFPLEELPPLLSACAATMRTTWSLFSAPRGG